MCASLKPTVTCLYDAAFAIQRKIAVTLDEIRKNAFAMPMHNPAYPCPPFRFLNREYFIISYETDMDALRAVVPEPLTVDNGLVHFEFIRTPHPSPFGAYPDSSP